MNVTNYAWCQTCEQHLVLEKQGDRVVWVHVHDTADHYPMPMDHALTAEIDRLARRLTVAREALIMGGPALLMQAVLAPVLHQLQRLDELFAAEPNALVPATAFVLDDETADLIASSRVPGLPDTVPADWLHPEHTECADGCGLDVNHDGACLDRPGGRQVCTHEEGEARA